MPLSDPVDGFRLAYDDHPGGDPDGGTVVLLHGWPGDRRDHRDVVALLADRCRVLVPDLRGFGDSTAGRTDDPGAFGADGQARSVSGLLDELGTGPAVVAGYDVGSRSAQALASLRPDLVRALVLSPPLPGAGTRVLGPEGQREFWYQAFHRLPLSEQLIDGSPSAARTYLAHFWTHWSGPRYTPDAAELDRLADAYGRPRAVVAPLQR